MGIAGFSSWFAQMYPAAYVPLQSRSADHLYVDIAGILHTVIRRGARLFMIKSRVAKT